MSLTSILYNQNCRCVYILAGSHFHMNSNKYLLNKQCAVLYTLLVYLYPAIILYLCMLYTYFCIITDYFQSYCVILVSGMKFPNIIKQD